MQKRNSHVSGLTKTKTTTTTTTTTTRVEVVRADEAEEQKRGLYLWALLLTVLLLSYMNLYCTVLLSLSMIADFFFGFFLVFLHTGVFLVFFLRSSANRIWSSAPHQLAFPEPHTYRDDANCRSLATS